MNSFMSSSSNGDNTLETLNALRAQNSRDASVSAYFNHQRKHSDNPDPETQQAWFRGMKDVLQELDEVLGCIPLISRWHFLDVGCCPGGFASYILSKNQRSSGVGISLAVESGGHGLLLEDNLQPRLDLNIADLTYYQLGPTVITDPKLQPLPFPPDARPFDLVLLDGHPLRTSTSGVGAYDQMSNRLLISQLIIGLQSTTISGTIIMKLAKPERPVTVKLLYMLDMLSLDLATWKPVCMHATRDTFYAVAKGFGHGRQGYRLQEWLYGLKALWVSLTYGGQKPGRVSTTDLDFIVTEMELEPFEHRRQQLSRHIWQVQASSLHGWKQAQGL